MLESTVARVRYALGNCARFASAPWRQKTIEPETATTIFGCSFGSTGWHHIRKTLEEYDRDAGIAPEATTLWKYLKNFTPASISELAGIAGEEPLPPFVYPWGSFNGGSEVSGKNAWTSRFCGPSTDAFVMEEFGRTIALYQTVRATGYRPYRYPNSFIGGTWMLAADGRRRFVVMQGNHRMAALAHLGQTSIAVRSMKQALKVVRESDIESWPLVASGRCSRTHARKVFQFFFDQSGWQVARLLGASPPAN